MPISRSVLHADVDYRPAFPKVKDDQTLSIEKIDEERAVGLAWAALKADIAARDKYHCRLCGRACRYGAEKITERADAHHIVFASAGGESQSQNLLYLCRGCHDMIHKVKKFFLSGNADQRDELGKGCVKVERQTEGGFETVGFV